MGRCREIIPRSCQPIVNFQANLKLLDSENGKAFEKIPCSYIATEVLYPRKIADICENIRRHLSVENDKKGCKNLEEPSNWRKTCRVQFKA